jgi:hypothetical protein
MPCGRPAPGRPIGRPGSGRPHGVIGVFQLMSISIIVFNIVPLIIEFDPSAAAKVMQQNVAAVAIVFCVCLLPSLIQYGEVGFQDEGQMITFSNSTTPTQITHFFLVLNNGVNIFIYIIFGLKFRTRLFNALTKCG